MSNINIQQNDNDLIDEILDGDWDSVDSRQTDEQVMDDGYNGDLLDDILDDFSQPEPTINETVDNSKEPVIADVKPIINNIQNNNEYISKPSIEYSNPISNVNIGIEDTKKIRVDWDKVGIKDKYILSLHQIIINTDNPSLFNGQLNYTNEDLGISLKDGVDLVKKDSEVIQPGVDLVVINEKGDTLGDFLKRRYYTTQKKSLLGALETLGDNNLIHTQNSEMENYKLDVLNKKAKMERYVKPGDEDAFLKKHMKKTKYEKSILRTLGISADELNKLVSPKSILSEEEKARLLNIGSGIENKRKGRRSKRPVSLSFGDLDILRFIDLCKFASLRNLYYANGMTGLGQLKYRLNRLEKMGIVRCVIVYNSPGVWSLTNTGKALIGSDRHIGKKEQAGLSSLSERIYVNHVMACLYSGCIDILNEGVKENRRDENGTRILGETIIPEFDIVSTMGKRSFELRGKVFTKDSYKGETANLLRETWEIDWRRWENSGRTGEPPDEGSPWHYILFYDTGVRSTYIIPDIVLHRPRLANGAPGNIAVEIERSAKTLDEYIRKLGIYKKDDRVYSKVVYVTDSKDIAGMLKEAAEKINFDRYDVVPMVDENGIVPTGKSHWLL